MSGVACVGGSACSHSATGTMPIANPVSPVTNAGTPVPMKNSRIFDEGQRNHHRSTTERPGTTYVSIASARILTETSTRTKVLPVGLMQTPGFPRHFAQALQSPGMRG